MYTMKEVCQEANLSYETLKYYCNEGLVPNVKRDKNNRRIFDEHDLAWIKDLTCLKNCHLSIEEMKAYLAMCLEGPQSIPQRKAFLIEKEARLKKEIKQLRDSVKYIAWKKDLYNSFISGEKKYTSNLIKKYNE